MWRKLCHVLEIDELIDDPLFITNADRLANIDELLPLLNARFQQSPAPVLAERLFQAGVPAAMVKGVLDALDQPQILYRKMVQDFEHDDRTRFRIVGDPLKLSESSDIPRRPPRLGEHTREVMRDFGYEDREIDRLIQVGVIMEQLDN